MHTVHSALRIKLSLKFTWRLYDFTHITHSADMVGLSVKTMQRVLQNREENSLDDGMHPLHKNPPASGQVLGKTEL